MKNFENPKFLIKLIGMNPLTKKEKIIIIAVILGVGLAIAAGAVTIAHSASRALKIYTQAFEDYKAGNLQNSYYQFSKVSFLSDLKPAAIYRQAKCAEDIEDFDAAIKQYQLLFNNYPSHRLSLRSKYHAARLLVESRPDLAQKYFEEILAAAPGTDYGIAAEYFLGKILLTSSSYLTDEEKLEIKNRYMSYLKKSPSGRWVQNILSEIKIANLPMGTQDYLLIAKSYYLLGDLKCANEALFHVPAAKSWALGAKINFSLGLKSKAKALTEYGLSFHAKDVNIDDLHDAVDLYAKTEPNEYGALSKLYSYPAPAGRDYILNLKCQSSPASQQLSCYRELYNKYPESEYTGDALANIFLIQVKNKEYAAAKINGRSYLNKYSSIKYSPMVMYWLGKVLETSSTDRDEYKSCYRGVIARYPDNYYAYRAYLILNDMHGAIINNYIKEKEVKYPYEINKDAKLNLHLAEVGDYDMLFELNDDEFVKSWIYYQKGDYSHSMLVARDAMEKIEDKPDKYDLRWRLVYPIDYYDLIKKYSSHVGNNSPLILAIVREESYFNPQAQSSVGAGGLMQLMPSTAKEIGSKHGVTIDSVKDLHNPEINIKLGSYYYAELKSMLNGLDISSVAAYNGGIGSVNRWKSSLYYNDTDEFVEQIPYQETKDYVKKVFRSYWNYIRIYSGNE